MSRGPKLDVLIVGAGIAGPAVAIGLSRAGHTVTILERYPKLHDYGAGVEIHPNGVRALRCLGVAPQLEEFVHRVDLLEIRDGFTGEVIGIDPYNKNGFAANYYGDEVWSANWKDCQRTLLETAKQHGSRVIFGADIEMVDVKKCIVKLRKSNEKNEPHDFRADVIIGADGIDSMVRSSIPSISHIKPVVAEEQCWRSTVSLQKMVSAKLEGLLQPGNEMVWTAPGKYILSAPSFAQNHYDVITCVQQSIDVPNARWGVKSTPDEARQDFRDFCPEAQKLLSLLDESVMWTLAEIPTLNTCRSENGRVVLTGDAWHAMLPHVGNGTASSLEDAVCLATCLDWSYSRTRKQAESQALSDVELQSTVSQATSIYESLRAPRVARIQKAGHEGFDFLGSKNSDFIATRNEILAKGSEDFTQRLDALERGECPTKKSLRSPDVNARFPTEAFRQWLSGYDIVDATRAELQER